MRATDTSGNISTAKDRSRVLWQRIIESIEDWAPTPCLAPGASRLPLAETTVKAAHDPLTSRGLMDVAQYSGRIHGMRAKVEGEACRASDSSVAADRGWRGGTRG